MNLHTDFMHLFRSQSLAVLSIEQVARKLPHEWYEQAHTASTPARHNCINKIPQ